jgi:geranylgeranyl reductase family protein
MFSIHFKRKNKMYDVIVVGAGPAGSMAAKKAADAGCKVLLVEKMQLPREKSCSGILIKKSINSVQKEFGKIPHNLPCKTKNKGIIITNEKNKQFKFESEGLNVWRSSFDQWLSSVAEESGVEVRQSTSAISCEEKEDHVVVKLQCNGTYYEKAKVLIACDGATSKIKRSLGKDQTNQILTYQTFCRGTIDLDGSFFYAFLDPKFSQYDAWFNVKDDFLVFGVGVKEAALIKSYHSRFLSFLASEFNAKIQSCVRGEIGILPYIMKGYNTDLGEGRVLFAGEAANFLNPMGEGISSALITGAMAAESAVSLFEDNLNIHNLVDLYKNRVADEKEYMIRQWKFLTNLSSRFSYLNSD